MADHIYIDPDGTGPDWQTRTLAYAADLRETARAYMLASLAVGLDPRAREYLAEEASRLAREEEGWKARVEEVRGR